MVHASSGCRPFARSLVVISFVVLAFACSDDDEPAGLDAGLMAGGADAGAVGGAAGGGSAGVDAAGGDVGSGGFSVGGFAGSSSGAPNPCVNAICEGVCEGESCASNWTCVVDQRACTDDLALYCGCEGRNFQDSSTCPRRSFARRGSCATLDCDQRNVRCRAAMPRCPDNLVPSVIDGCWGPCVDSQLCACDGDTKACPLGFFTCSLGQCLRLLI